MEMNSNIDNRLRDRETLKSYFRKGGIPTEEQFAALIDSQHNICEDGELKVNGKDGLVLIPSGGDKAVAAVYSKRPEFPDASLMWRIAAGDGGELELRNGKGDTVLVIGQDAVVTVPGEIRSGRYLSGKGDEIFTGNDGVFKVNADGHWHDLPVEYADNGRSSSGCRVYRICAGWYHPRSGRYSVCEAIASHADGRLRRIRSARKHWWGWGGKTKLRWQLHDGHLYLQARCRGTRRGAEFICCRIETVFDM